MRGLIFQAGCGLGCRFDLFLDQWNGQAWRTVARSTGPAAQERLTFNGSAGFYRYRVAAVSQSALYAAGALGTIAPRTRLARHPVCALPAFFCMVNVAGATAAWNVMTGHRIERWEPRRPTAGPPPASRSAADETLAVLGAGR